MPTEKKRQQVQELKEHLERCTIAIATDYRGMSVPAFTELRRRLRESEVEYKVVKNRLALIAAGQAQNMEFKRLLDGPTGVAFGYGQDPQVLAKILNEFIKTTRAPLVIRAAIVDGYFMTGAQVQALASLPSRPQLLAQLLGQLNAPLVGLVTALSAPTRGLATVLQQHVKQVSNRVPQGK